MSYCPRIYGSDMTDPANLAYCLQIQRQGGESCKRCPWAERAEEMEKAPERKVKQGRLF